MTSAARYLRWVVCMVSEVKHNKVCFSHFISCICSFKIAYFNTDPPIKNTTLLGICPIQYYIQSSPLSLYLELYLQYFIVYGDSSRGQEVLLSGLPVPRPWREIRESRSILNNNQLTEQLATLPAASSPSLCVDQPGGYQDRPGLRFEAFTAVYNILHS